MSGVMKSLGKIFKPIWKVLKIVAVVVLAAAAIYFTAGAAIPALGAVIGTGGLAGAASGAVAAVGISTTSTLGAALSGAITFAGYGAVAGGVMAAVTGKPILKGMSQGALSGAIMGGVGGAVGLITPAAPSWGPGVAANPGTSVGSGMVGGAQGVPAVTPASPAVAAPTTVSAGVGAPTSVVAAPTAVPSSGGLFGPNGWIEQNKTLAGSVIQGIGGALEGDPYGDALRERERQFTENYEPVGSRGLFTPNSTSYLDTLPGLRAPADQWSAATPPGSQSTYGYRYEYDPAQRKVVKVQAAPKTA